MSISAWNFLPRAAYITSFDFPRNYTTIERPNFNTTRDYKYRKRVRDTEQGWLRSCVGNPCNTRLGQVRPRLSGRLGWTRGVCGESFITTLTPRDPRRRFVRMCRPHVYLGLSTQRPADVSAMTPRPPNPKTLFAFASRRRARYLRLASQRRERPARDVRARRLLELRQRRQPLVVLERAAGRGGRAI